MSTEPPAVAQIRRRLNEHAATAKGHDLKDFGNAVTVTRITESPVYLATLETVCETREVIEREKQYDGAGPRTPRITPANADLWSTDLDFKGESFPKKPVEHPLAGSEVPVACTRCNLTGSVACSRCGGTGTTRTADKNEAVCDRCQGGKTVTCPACKGQKYTGIKYLAVRQSFEADERCETVAGGEVTPAAVGQIDAASDAREVLNVTHPRLPDDFAEGPNCGVLRDWFQGAVNVSIKSLTAKPGVLGGLLKAATDARTVVEPARRIARQTARVRACKTVVFQYRYAGKEYTGVLLGEEKKLHLKSSPATEFVEIRQRIGELARSRRASKFMAWLDTAHHRIPLALALLPFAFCLLGVPFSLITYGAMGIESGLARFVAGGVLWGLLLSVVAVGFLPLWYRLRRDDASLDAHLAGLNAAATERAKELEGELARLREGLGEVPGETPAPQRPEAFVVLSEAADEVRTEAPQIMPFKPVRRLTDWLPYAGGVLSFLLLVGLCTGFMGLTTLNKVHGKLARAGSLWDVGQRGEAAALYRDVVELLEKEKPNKENNGYKQRTDIESKAEAIAFGRLVEYEAGEGNDNVARQWLAKARERQIGLSGAGPNTTSLMEQIRQEKEEEDRRQRALALAAEREKQRQMEAEERRQREVALAAEQERERQRERQREEEELARKEKQEEERRQQLEAERVKREEAKLAEKGIFKVGQITVELAPNVAKAWEFSSLKIEDSGTVVTAVVKWRGGEPSRLRYYAYDGDKVKVDDSALDYQDYVVGEKAKIRMVLSNKLKDTRLIRIVPK